MVKAFIFDLDGVITDTSEHHYQAWKALAETLGFSIDRTFNEQLKGISRKDSLERILSAAGLQNAYSQEEKMSLMTSKNEQYQEMIQSLGPENILPGIADLLEQIKLHGYQLALASASQNAPMILTSLQLADTFDVIADPANIQQNKPAPDIFLLAARELNIPPSECIAIEDALSGIEAIQRAGMCAIGIGDPVTLKAAELVVPASIHLTLEDMLNTCANRQK